MEDHERQMAINKVEHLEGEIERLRHRIERYEAALRGAVTAWDSLYDEDEDADIDDRYRYRWEQRVNDAINAARRALRHEDRDDPSQSSSATLEE